jgi:hypothetical protein
LSGEIVPPLSQKSRFVKADPSIATRNPEKYLVQHANTERLRKSAIIYMQNLLNENEYK